MRLFYAKLNRDASADDFTQFCENLDGFDSVQADFGGIRRGGAILKSTGTSTEVEHSLHFRLSGQNLVELVELTAQNMRPGAGDYVGFIETYRNRFMPFDDYPEIGEL